MCKQLAWGTGFSYLQISCTEQHHRGATPLKMLIIRRLRARVGEPLLDRPGTVPGDAVHGVRGRANGRWRAYGGGSSPILLVSFVRSAPALDESGNRML